MIRTLPVSLLLATFLVSGAGEAQTVKLSDIPNPRPNGWVTDLTGRIPPGALGEINRLGDEVKAQAKGEIAVAVVADIDDVNTRGFATRLFNRWGLGRRGTAAGVLIFVSLDDRRAEIILGSGIDSPQQRRTSEEIVRSAMAPRLLEGDPAGALRAGMQGCAQRILEIQPAAPEENTPASSVVTGFLAVTVAFCLFLFFTRRAPSPWPHGASAVRSAEDDGDERALLRRSG